MYEVSRFANRPLSLPDGLHWDAAGLFAAALDGLRQAGPLRSVGVDSWGVDYTLVDAQGRSDGIPYHYRDARTNGRIEQALGLVDAQDLYATTGIQVMPINTAFQLLAEPLQRLAGKRMLLISDLISYWLSGEAGQELTQASTTGLLDAGTGSWAHGVIDALGLPGDLFGPLIEPGTTLGPIRAELGCGRLTVTAVAGHDTGSAFVGAPVRGPRDAVVSSGTWSLVGAELPEPVLTAVARAANLSNERGVDGTTRLLRNVMGLWLEQECARAWGVDHGELQRRALAAKADVPLFDPDDESLLRPGRDMPDRIAALWRASGQEAGERDQGTVVRGIYLALACKYRYVLELLERATGGPFDRIHVIGGGARVPLLCQLTADVTGHEVLAGPVEASAIGNVLMQARTAGELGTLPEIRDVVMASFPPTSYLPNADADGEEQYERFLRVTELRSPIENPTAVRG